MTYATDYTNCSDEKNMKMRMNTNCSGEEMMNYKLLMQPQIAQIGK
jgi:hypothetical protein